MVLAGGRSVAGAVVGSAGMMDYANDANFAADWRRYVEREKLVTVQAPLAVAVTGLRFMPHVSVGVRLGIDGVVRWLALSPAEAVELRDALNVAVPMVGGPRTDSVDSEHG